MKKQNKIAIYPGSFDPITNGHIDIIQRASGLFDEVIVVIAQNMQKTPLFSVDERKELIRESVKEIAHVTVDSFSGLLVDYAVNKGAKAIIRGLRAVSDFEFELQMALVNRKLCEEITTVFLMPHENYTYLNSSIVRELKTLNGDISSFVPKHVEIALKNKLRT